MILYEEDNWELRDTENIGHDRYLLTHPCPVSTYEIIRYGRLIHRPCGFCGGVCPDGLQGLYNILAVL